MSKYKFVVDELLNMLSHLHPSYTHLTYPFEECTINNCIYFFLSHYYTWVCVVAVVAVTVNLLSVPEVVNTTAP